MLISAQQKCDVRFYLDLITQHPIGAKLNPNKTQLDSLLLESKDIKSYNSETFSFTLTKTASARLAKLNLDHKVFTVVADNNPILSGWFWPCESSLGTRAFVANNFNCTEPQTLQINYGVPQLAFAENDPRDKIYPSDIPHLVGCWTHSKEEELPGDTIQFFRPCDFRQVTASRNRFQMELNKDSTCKWLYLASKDAPSINEGTWQFDSLANSFKIIDLRRNMVYNYRIVNSAKKLLELKHIPGVYDGRTLFEIIMDEERRKKLKD